MRSLWATVFATWALFAVLALLAWTRPLPTPAPANIPTAVVVKGKNGQSSSGRRERRRLAGTRDDAHLAGSRGMIGAATAAVPVAWLVARAAGLVAFALFTVAVTLGLAFSTRLLGTSRGKMLLGWHQTLMWTGLAMVALHGSALALDPVMHFGIAGVLVPGIAPWRPVPVAAGIVTAWIMLALAASFHLRRRIGQRRWRLLHYAGFAGFAIGLYHALNVGTDLTGPRGLIFAGIVAAPVVWLVYARILMPRPGARRAPVRPTPSAPSTGAAQSAENVRAPVPV